MRSTSSANSSSQFAVFKIYLVAAERAGFKVAVADVMVLSQFVYDKDTCSTGRQAYVTR
jgi:hypothetical protein